MAEPQNKSLPKVFRKYVLFLMHKNLKLDHTYLYLNSHNQSSIIGEGVGLVPQSTFDG